MALPPALPTHLARLAALSLGLVWAFLAGPEFRAALAQPDTRWAVLAGLVGLALGLVVTPVGRGVETVLRRVPTWAFVGVACAVSAAVSWWLWHGPMNGQVISGDACIYILQGRAASHGELSIPVSAPRLAHGAKFLLEGRDGRLHSVFVPGFPMFLAPFLRVGAPWLAGMTTGALLALAQTFLARAMGLDAFALRLSLLLVAPGFARAVETTDLLSHAWVGTLDLVALALVAQLRERVTARRALALGACVGWVFCARMLDGFVLSAVVTAGLVDRALTRRFPLRFIAMGVAAALPFIALVAVQQHRATGDWRKPTVIEYVQRADTPPSCLRLGFGPDVGCALEHAVERASFGPDGYTPDDALRIVRERTGRLGTEVFGLTALPFLAFLAVLLRPTAMGLTLALFPVLLTVAYAGFYYGNGTIHGARHVFPAAPVLALLMAQSVVTLADRLRDRRRERLARALPGAALLGYIALGALAFPPLWHEGLRQTRRIQGRRLPLRTLMAAQGIDRGIVIIADIFSHLEALDPWRDGADRVIVPDDFSGVRDLRRFRPELPVWLALPTGQIVPIRSSPPGPGLYLEFERAWPSWERPEGCVGGITHTLECCRIPASGGRSLTLLNAVQGARFSMPFEMSHAGVYRFRLDGIRGPNHGRWEIAVDGRPLPPWEGYAARFEHVRNPWSAPVALTAGRHSFTARNVGRASGSTGYVASFDVLVAEPADSVRDTPPPAGATPPADAH